MQVIDRRKALSIPPIWRLAFRPFFLAGSVFALFAVPLWILAWSGLSALWLMQDGMDAAGRLDVGRMAARELDLPD